ncbi:MAG: FixH family protein [Xanthobacteraceae bacterium]|nr:FixH family protein [Xanthobacteraceae bacterium]
MVFHLRMKPVVVLPGVAATLVLAVVVSVPAHAQTRAKAEITCKQAAGPLQYDCVVKLNDARSNAPLTGVTLSIGADMPSMPGMHHLRPARAVEDVEKGTYRVGLVLDMHGEWALQLNLSGPVRDRVVKLLRFEGAEVTEPKPGERARRRH